MFNPFWLFVYKNFHASEATGKPAHLSLKQQKSKGLHRELSPGDLYTGSCYKNLFHQDSHLNRGPIISIICLNHKNNYKIIILCCQVFKVNCLLGKLLIRELFSLFEAFFVLPALWWFFISMFSKKLIHPNYAGTLYRFVSPVNIISIHCCSYKDFISAGCSNW